MYDTYMNDTDGLLVNELKRKRSSQFCINLNRIHTAFSNKPFFKPIRGETKPRVTWLTCAFSRAWHRFHVFASSSDWFVMFVVIGLPKLFSFCFYFRRVVRNPLYLHLQIFLCHWARKRGIIIFL